MTLKLNNKRSVVLALVAALAIAVAAVGYWTTGGSGNGTVSTGDVAEITVNQDTVLTGMYPGESAHALSGDFNNQNAGKVYIKRVTAVVTGTEKPLGTPNPGCDATDFAIEGTSNTPGEIDPGNDKGAWNGLTIRLVDKPDANQDACKNAVVKISYTAHAS